MTTEAALMAAVLNDPGSDDVRLILADALDEIGEPERSEFIRVQCELARWKGKDEEHCPICGQHWRWRVGAGWDEWSDCEQGHRWTSMKHRDLCRREGELLGAHWPAWCSLPGAFCANLWPAPPCPTPHVTFRRGFLAEITTDLADWLAHGPAIVRSHPVEFVLVSDKRPRRSSEGDYCWATEEGPDVPPWRLPEAVADFLDSRPRALAYPSTETAMKALSAALLQLAKDQGAKGPSPSGV